MSALGIAALALATPGSALAHRGHHHHKSNSKARHVRVHFEHFGAVTATPESTTGKGGGTQTKAPVPLASEPTASSEDAGKVASFKEGVLTITLADGSTVSGKVTSRTEIECMKAPTTAPEGAPGEDKDSGEDVGSGDDQSSDDGQQEATTEDGGDSNDDSGEDGGEATASPEPPCDSSTLTPGTIVREAELRISSATGAEFESVQLVR